MLKAVAAGLAGIVFGLGLGVSQMVNPQKVLAFLDIAGDWDPSLALVMGGAVVVGFLTFRLVLRRPAPVLAETFILPDRNGLDFKLLAGAGTFGVGWGLVGFCPGPAIASFAYGSDQTLLFVGAMIVGMIVANTTTRTSTVSPTGEA